MEKVLDMAADRGLECEIYGEDTESFQVEVFRGEVESVDRAKEAGLGMRAVCGGRVGFAWTCDLSDEGLAVLLTEAESNAASGDETDGRRLPERSGSIRARRLWR